MGIALALASAGAALMLMTAGCGQRSDFEPNNRGANTETLPTSVDNAYIVPAFVPGRCAIQAGSAAELRFTVSNTRPAESERLLAIATGAADAVRLPAGATDIAPKASQEFTAAVEGLREDLRPAMSVDVTFRFDKAGDIELRVPIEACPTQQT
ncbi:hypothetical protein [Mycobacterium hubeiense]|uniref:hypothetical protein n=1 Tax=Mycobacterium hubeiense TaxID=1867256 RepID=UPI000C7F411A|nr:hypothetical protein [Mycobacterium sp. QGD 101]